MLAPFLIQCFPKKKHHFLSFVQMNHMQIFFLVSIYVFAEWFFVGRERKSEREERTFHVLAFFRLLFSLLFICLFGMIYVLFGVHMNVKIKIRAIDVCESHIIWCMPCEMGKRFSSWWSQEWILWQFFFVCAMHCACLICVILRNYCLHKNGAFVRTHIHTHIHSY